MFLRSAEREQLAAARQELYVAGVALDYDGRYGPQCLYWLSAAGWKGERVLALEATETRRRQVADLRQMLRAGADKVGPFVLGHRRTSSGRAAWALLDLDEPGAQLALDDDERR